MRGRLTLELRAHHPPHAYVASRREKNTVLQGGARLVAELFAGQGVAITHMGVGTSDADPDLTTTTALTNAADGDIPALLGDTTTAVAADAFSFTTDDVRRLVQVRVRATLAPTAAVGRIREAGLLARPAGGDGSTDVLYNRVTFAPIDKGDDHDLTLFWEIDFPFGDLQWLS